MNFLSAKRIDEKKEIEKHPFLARLLFDYRRGWVVLFLLVTVFLGYHASKVHIQTGFEKMVPHTHPYIQNYLAHRSDVQGGNIIRIAVADPGKNIFNDQYLKILREITDEVFLIPGVDRAGLKSLWTKNVQWRAVTEEGFDGGIIVPDTYDGSDASVNQVKKNVMRSGQIGRLVANDFGSTIIEAPLLEINPSTGEPLNYSRFSAKLDEIREKYNDQGVSVHIIGFAKLLGDMIDGTTAVAGFFAVTFLITFVLLYWYCRCIRGTIAPLVCSLMAVIWQLGAIRLLGYGIDPYSVLVPFLVFAIGVSHGVQMVNATALAFGRGFSSREAGRRAFSKLFRPGISALLSDAVGFLTLIFIQIKVIQELAIAASIGIAAIIFTNLLLLPMIISIIGICETGINHATEKRHRESLLAAFFAKFTGKKYARATLIMALILVAFGLVLNKDLKIGDLDRGAPELHPDSQYNKDVDFVTHHFSTSSDIMIVMVKTKEQQSISYAVLDAIDRLQWQLQHVPGVQSTYSVANIAKFMNSMLNEGNPRWYGLSRDQGVINNNILETPPGLISGLCDLSNVIIFLEDHKAETLDRITSAVEKFDAENGGPEVSFLLAAGSAGIEAATNQAIKTSQMFMLIFVYTVVAVMVFFTFRSVKAVLCIIIPLGLTSLLCQALMAKLGIGVKVATLPVIALGVGVGVDYGIYIFSRMREFLEEGESLYVAFSETLKTTGRAVTFTGLTLAVGVFTWVFSPLKFQVDMGILLTFMFLWNMLGVMTLLPSLAFLFLKNGKEVAVKESEKTLKKESAFSLSS